MTPTRVASLVNVGALHPDDATEARLREFASLEARQRANGATDERETGDAATSEADAE